MADETATTHSNIAQRSPWHWPKRILAAVFIFLFLLILLGFAAYIWLDSKHGHQFITAQIEGQEFENGMKITIGKLQGSIYDELEIQDLAIADPKGVFVRVPQAKLDWSPFALLNSHVAIDSLTAKTAHVLRLPEFRDVPDNGDPILPNIDIDIGRLSVEQIDIAQAVTGQRHIASLSGTAKIADRRAQITLDAKATTLRDMAGGDILKLNLDAVPDDNKFDVDAQLAAPAGGLFASLTGITEPLQLSLSGKGDWSKWTGRLTGLSGGAQIADIDIAGRESRFNLSGHVRAGSLLSGQTAQLFEPKTYITLRADLNERQAALYGGIANANFAAGTDGLVDFGNNVFRDLDLFVRVKRPSVLAANISGDNVQFRALLNGNWAQPVAAYNLQAARLAFDQMAVEGLSASGETRIKGDRIIIPVSARAKRIAGLNKAAGELLTMCGFRATLPMPTTGYCPIT
ncbi:MAG: hypothetical protein HC843_09215 [Sphingomonadales bacterium]|nr:hypothetical protein [Sphingomonadales bacterium]